MAKIIAYGYKGYSYLHAAVLIDKNRNVFMFPGNSGSGKTTISRVLIKNGWGCLSDDSVLIREKSRGEKSFALISFKNTINTPKNKRIKKIFIRHPQKVIMLFPKVKNAEANNDSPHKNRTRILNISPVKAMEILMRSSAHMVTVPHFARRQMRLLSDLLNMSRCYRIELARDMLRDKRVVLREIELVTRGK